MFGDILVPITRTDGDSAAVDAAAALARAMQGRLTLSIAVIAPQVLHAIGGAYPSAMYGQLYAQEREQAQALAAQWRDALRQADDGLRSEVRVVDAGWKIAGAVAAAQARYADLAVVAAPGSGEQRHVLEPMFADVLTGSGRPVLTVPSVHTMRLPLLRVLVAWQPTREATRALHDALPLLHDAAAIDVLVVDPEVGELQHGDEPGADIAAHLARHGLQVRVVRVPSLQSVGQTILHHAVQTDAQLIVAGGYSHSRLREQIIGGATRELLARSHVPVLFSH